MLSPEITHNYGSMDKRCHGTDRDFYTYIPKNDSCKGWKTLSLDECKAKCDNNEILDGCHDSEKKCAYILYNPKHKVCNLADENCDPTHTYDVAEYQFLKRIGKN